MMSDYDAVICVHGFVVLSWGFVSLWWTVGLLTQKVDLAVNNVLDWNESMHNNNSCIIQYTSCVCSIYIYILFPLYSKQHYI